MLAWSEVLAYHRTRKGIGKQSLLVDRGESGYRNRFLPDGRILYMGEGRRGHQEPRGGHLRLLLAHKAGRPLRASLREAPGRWRPLWPYRGAAWRSALWQEAG